MKGASLEHGKIGIYGNFALPNLSAEPATAPTIAHLAFLWPALGGGFGNGAYFHLGLSLWHAIFQVLPFWVMSRSVHFIGMSGKGMGAIAGALALIPIK